MRSSTTCLGKSDDRVAPTVFQPRSKTRRYLPASLQHKPLPDKRFPLPPKHLLTNPIRRSLRHDPSPDRRPLLLGDPLPLLTRQTVAGAVTLLQFLPDVDEFEAGLKRTEQEPVWVDGAGDAGWRRRLDIRSVGDPPVFVCPVMVVLRTTRPLRRAARWVRMR